MGRERIPGCRRKIISAFISNASFLKPGSSDIDSTVSLVQASSRPNFNSTIGMGQ